uniref:Uncharacterized protein n=1 Tax=Anguilla anguilla TaxID=7936 RepID=A0A0E9VHN7_ANGAN
MCSRDLTRSDVGCTRACCFSRLPLIHL